jgi:hypothetical protein
METIQRRFDWEQLEVVQVRFDFRRRGQVERQMIVNHGISFERDIYLPMRILCSDFELNVCIKTVC